MTFEFLWFLGIEDQYSNLCLNLKSEDEMAPNQIHSLLLEISLVRRFLLSKFGENS